jgi:hypothetical protein
MIFSSDTSVSGVRFLPPRPKFHFWITPLNIESLETIFKFDKEIWDMEYPEDHCICVDLEFGTCYPRLHQPYSQTRGVHPEDLDIIRKEIRNRRLDKLLS